MNSLLSKLIKSIKLVLKKASSKTKTRDLLYGIKKSFENLI
jgi:hypothetical protein